MSRNPYFARLGGYSPEPPHIPRPVTTANFDDWCLDPRGLTFEEYMAETVPVDRGWCPSPPPGASRQSGRSLTGIIVELDAESRPVHLTNEPGAILHLPAGTDYRPC